MTKNLPHQEIGHDDAFIKYVKKGVLLIKKYPYHVAIGVVAVISLIILLANLFGRKSMGLKTQDQIHQAMNSYEALNYGENTQEVLMSIGQSMERLSKTSAQDTLYRGLITTLEGYAFALQIQYQAAAEKWQKVFSGEVSSPKIVHLIATLSFTDMVDPVNSVSIIFPILNDFFIEDSGLAMLALLDAGENAALTIMYDTTSFPDSIVDQIFDMGKTALDFSAFNMTNISLKNEAFLYRDLLNVAYQVKNNRIDKEQ